MYVVIHAQIPAQYLMYPVHHPAMRDVSVTLDTCRVGMAVSDRSDVDVPTLGSTIRQAVKFYTLVEVAIFITSLHLNAKHDI